MLSLDIKKNFLQPPPQDQSVHIYSIAGDQAADELKVLKQHGTVCDVKYSPDDRLIFICSCSFINYQLFNNYYITNIHPFHHPTDIWLHVTHTGRFSCILSLLMRFEWVSFTPTT